MTKVIERKQIKSDASTDLPLWKMPIIHVPLQQAFPALGEVKEFSNKICLFNHDRTKVFDVVSPKYQVIEHADAYSRINRALKMHFHKEVSCVVRSFNQGARIRAEFKLPIPPIRLGKNDVSELTLVLRNSYDRCWSFSALLGAFRLVCENGMMIGTQFAGIKGKHVGTMDDVSMLASLEHMIGQAPRLKEVWEEWSDTRITQVGAHALLVDQFPEKYLRPVLDSKFPKSKWELYNQLTAFATHETRSLQRRVEFDEKIAKLFYGDSEDGELVEE